MAHVYLLSAGRAPAVTLATLRDCLTQSVLADTRIQLVLDEKTQAALQALPDAGSWLQHIRLAIDLRRNPLTCADLITDDDVVLLAAGVRLPLAWDARLCGMAAAQPGFATISPLCAGFGLTTPRFAEPDGDLALRDRAVLYSSSGSIWSLPQASPLCVHIRGSWLASCRDVVADLCSMAGRIALGSSLQVQGAAHGAGDSLLVDWDGDPVQPQVPVHLDGRLQAFEHANPLRFTVYGEQPVPTDLHDGRPVQLHVMHSWGGGLERWVRDYCAGSPDRKNLVLKSIGNIGLYGQRLALFLDIEHADPVRIWEFADGIRGTAHFHHEYAAVIREITRTYLVDSVIVSSLIGHSLDVLRTGLPTLHVWHEFYPYCPALYIHFGGTCTSCTPERLLACSSGNPLNNLFRTVLPAEWPPLRAAYLDTVSAQQVGLVAPSPSVIRYFGELEPALLALNPRVIPHGVSWEPASALPRVEGSRLKLVVLGMLTEYKGLGILQALLPQIAGFADIVLLGCGESGGRFADMPNVTVVRGYQRPDLPALLAEMAPDAGLLLSIVPETFSYTLSELMCAGIPPVLANHGAYADRVQHGRNGFLCASNADAYAATLRQLHADRNLLLQARAVLAIQQHRSREEMVADYAALLSAHPMQGGFTPLRRGYSTEPVPLVGANAFPDSMRQAVFTAHGFLRTKLAATPRLKNWQRKLASRGLEFTMRVIYRFWRLVSKERW